MTVDGWMDGWTLRSSYLTTLPGTRIPVESQSPTANPSERPSAPLKPIFPYPPTFPHRPRRPRQPRQMDVIILPSDGQALELMSDAVDDG